MKRIIRVGLLLCALCAVTTLAVSAQAGTKNLTLRVASGGGSIVTAGDYTLVAAVGQHDAATRSSGGYLMVGGVLAASGGAIDGSPPTPTPTSPPPTATPPPPTNSTYLPVITK